MTDHVIDRRTAAVSAALRGLLDGDPTPARVLAVFPHAIYLEVEQGIGPQAVAEDPDAPAVVAVVTADGLVHPNAAVLTCTSAEQPFSSCRAGMAARVGQDRIELAPFVVTVSRWWDPRPVLPTVGAAPLAERVGVTERFLTARVGAMPRELVRGADGVATALAARVDLDTVALDTVALDTVVLDSVVLDSVVLDTVVAASRQLIGLGPGLTPSGDDVLCGLFAAAILLGRSLADDAAQRGDERAAAVPEGVAAVACAGRRIAGWARGRTTTLSQALLWHAARGEAAGPLADTLRALSGAGPLEPSLDGLLAVGSTSGRDLAFGVTVGARLALRSWTAAPASLSLPSASGSRP